MNDFGKTPIRLTERKVGSSIISNLDFDFTERIYDIQYRGIVDMFAKLGGLRASIAPLMGYFVPLLALHFLYSLAGILDEKLEDQQFNEMVNLIKTARNQFRMIKLSHDYGQVYLDLKQKKLLNECL